MTDNNQAYAEHTPSVRTDFRTRDVVNQAVAAVPKLGVQKAAEFLAAMNVPSEVAIRTLVYASRRQ